MSAPGYDISDYYGVDPRYGSSGDFVDFASQARERGIKIIIDLVMNHTSDQHPWFKAACSDKSSKFRNSYTWSKKRPRNYREGVIFPGVQQATWSRDPVAKEWYYHRFYKFQPDLDVENPDVRTEIQRTMGYWLEAGTSGFRVDAAPFLIESQQPNKTHSRHYEYLTEFRDFLQWREGDAIIICSMRSPRAMQGHWRMPWKRRNAFRRTRSGQHFSGTMTNWIWPG